MRPGHPADRNTLVAVVSRWLALYAIAAGALSFAGWAFDVRRLADWDNDGIAIQPNTALACVTAGVSLLALLDRSRRLLAVFAALTALIGGTVLIENLFGISFGIDDLFLFDRDWGRRATTAPGRMGVPASLCFLLIGAAILAAPRSPAARRTAAATGIAVILISTLSLMGYLFGSDSLYSLPALTAIALQTSTIVFSLGLGLVFALPDCPPLSGMLEDSIAAQLARRAVPLILIGPVVLGWIRQAGERASYYDTAMGIALSTLALTVCTFAVLVWGVSTVADRERELVRSRKSQEEAENRFRLAAEAVNGIIYEYDFLSRTVTPVRGVSEVLGYRSGEISFSGDWWRAQIHPDDLPRLAAVMSSVIGGESVLTEYRARRRDGRWLYLEDRGLISRDDAGRPQRLLGCAIDITARKEQENRLRERETLLSLAVDAAALGVFEWNPTQGRAVWHNDRIYEIFGRERAQGPVLAEEFRKDVCHPDDLAQWERGVPAAVEGQQDYDYTGRILRSDGSERWIEIAGRFIGSEGWMLGTVQDITDQKRRGLRDSFFRRLDDAIRPLAEPEEIRGIAARMLGEQLGASRCVYADVESDGETVHVAGDYCRGVPSLVGSYRMTALGHDFQEAMQSGVPFVVDDVEKDPRCEASWDRLLAASIRAAACVALRKDGRLVAAIALHQDVPRAWKDDEVDFLSAVADRIWESIERARVVRDLRENEHRLRLSQEAGRIGSFEWLIPEDRVIWSAELEHLYGLPPGTFEGTLSAWASRVVPDDAREVIAGIKQAFASRAERYDYEFRIILPGGGNHWLRGRAQLLYSRSGEPLRMIGVNIDVDEQKRATEALRAEDRRKNQFLATLAHELRNPLAPVRTGLEILKLSAADPGQLDEVVDMMGRQIQQMVRLIDDLLDISRITQGKIRLRREPCQLTSILAAALDTARPNLEANGIELTVSAPPQTIHLNADVTRLGQVFSNLLNNAAKYTPRGGHVRLSAELEQDEVVVRVRDSGIGIPEAMLDRVFDMFTQVDESIERSHGGLGIGLSLVKALVEMHGGTVSASSAGDGQGSEFTVRLPLAEAASDPGRAPVNGHQPPAGAPLRIVIVDDNVDAARILARLLEKKGHEVTAIHDSRQALEAIEARRPDLVLLDLGLPHISGYEIGARIRKSEWGRSLVVSALTGWGQEEDRQKTREAGFDHHLVKPVDPQLLEDVIRGVQRGTAPSPTLRSS